MVKRPLDIVFGSIGLVVLAPSMLPTMVLIWLQGLRSPFYVATRASRAGRPFRMVKLRTMVVGADATGIDSTAAADPRITDMSSIVFADEGEIPRHSADADLDDNRLIRPWKSRLALFNIERRSDVLDIALMVITVVGIVSRRAALGALSLILRHLDAPAELRRVARREETLIPTAPPGADHPVVAADLRELGRGGAIA